MRCKNCGCRMHATVLPVSEAEPVTHQKKINRLLTKRQKLQHLNQYLVSARDGLYQQGKHGTWRSSTPEFDMLIALEGLHGFLRTDLNHDLQKYGLPPLMIKRGRICDNE